MTNSTNLATGIRIEEWLPGDSPALVVNNELDLARSEGETPLTLDTVSGSNAEFLYRSLGYSVSGVIPRYARAALTPQLEATTIMYKELRP